jgi:hypothetical protein
MSPPVLAGAKTAGLDAGLTPHEPARLESRPVWRDVERARSGFDADLGLFVSAAAATGTGILRYVVSA